MPTKSLRCCVELNIRAVSCPGVWLHSREDVYVRFTLFGQIRTTRRVSPIFPLLFCETFQFDKVFYGAHAPSQVADDLLCENIQIELLQDSLTSACGRRLAVYIRNAADFLYPESSGLPRCCGCKDRDILMERSFDFPGISPKLEFSTTTTIKEAYSPYNDADLWRSGRSTRKSRSTSRKSRPRTRSACCRPSCCCSLCCPPPAQRPCCKLPCCISRPCGKPICIAPHKGCKLQCCPLRICCKTPMCCAPRLCCTVMGCPPKRPCCYSPPCCWPCTPRSSSPRYCSPCLPDPCSPRPCSPCPCPNPCSPRPCSPCPYSFNPCSPRPCPTNPCSPRPCSPCCVPCPCTSPPPICNTLPPRPRMCFPVHPRCRSVTRKGKYDQATIASISRSRSASPRWCPRLGDECDDLAERPPFVVRKAEFQKLVGRTPGSKKIKSKYAKKTKRGRSVSPRPLSRCTVECIHCDGLFPESQCTLCRVYRRYTGQPYSYHFAPGCCCFNSKVIREPGNDPKPIYESDCDSEDSEVVSYKSYRSPSPYRSYVGRSSPACLRDNDLDSLDELAIDLQRARNRSTALERKCRKKRSKSRSLTSSSNRLTETDFRARLQLQ